MTKEEMEKKLSKLLTVLMQGNPLAVKKAKIDIERLWRQETGAFKKGAGVALEYLSKFNQIRNVKNQRAFVSGLSLFYLVLGDDHFDDLKDFTLEVFQHPSGHVREAIRKTADWLYVSLTARAEPFTYPKGKGLSKKQKALQKEARYQYVKLVREVELLIDEYDEGEEVKYIEEMKPSVSKSLQLFWSRLTESPVYRKIVTQARPLSKEIIQKRRELENKLAAILKKSRSNLGVQEIKDIIYDEEGQDSLTEIITLLGKTSHQLKLDEVLEVVNDAWNYFPHKSLDGLSPMEKLMEYEKYRDVNKLN